MQAENTTSPDDDVIFWIVNFNTAIQLIELHA